MADSRVQLYCQYEERERALCQSGNPLKQLEVSEGGIRTQESPGLTDPGDGDSLLALNLGWRLRTSDPLNQ